MSMKVILFVYFFQAIPDIQIGFNREFYSRNDKRCSRASDSSSAYSSMMQLSIDDTEELPSNLAEGLVDSDDEEGYGESTEVRTSCFFTNFGK